MPENLCTYVYPAALGGQTCGEAPNGPDHQSRNHTSCKEDPVAAGPCSLHVFQSAQDTGSPEPVQTISIEPSTGGYANIAVTFANSIMSDVRLNRRAAVAEQLGQLVRIAGYLGQADPGALLDLQSSVEAL